MFDGVLGLGTYEKGLLVDQDRPSVEIADLEHTFIDELHQRGVISSAMFSLNINHHEQREEDSLYIGGWDESVVQLEEDLEWYPYYQRFSLPFEYLFVGTRNLMLDIVRSLA